MGQVSRDRPAGLDGPLLPADDSCRLRVKVTPKADRDDIVGLAQTPAGTAVAVRVRAAPDKGRANAAVCAILAAWLGLAKSVITVAAGETARIKIVHIAAPAERIAGPLAELKSNT